MESFFSSLKTERTARKMYRSFGPFYNCVANAL
jgi:hypothetical protein